MSRLVRTVDTDELIRYVRAVCNLGVDSLRLANEVWVERAKNHSGMWLLTMTMELQKVSSLVGQQNPSIRCRKREYLGIWNCGIRSVGVQRSQHVVPETPQFHYNLKGDVLVRTEASHLLGLILANVRLYFLSM